MRAFLLFLFFLTTYIFVNAQEQRTLLTNDSINQISNISDSVLIPAYELYAKRWETHFSFRKGLTFPDSKDGFLIVLVGEGDNSFVMPVLGELTSDYGWRRSRMHYGIDLRCRIGDTILCAFDGVVRYTGFSKGYGRTVIVRHNNGLETLYAHLNESAVVGNQYIKAGDLIGYGGKTGRTSTPHLHFETRFLEEAFNPNDIIDVKNKVLKDNYVILNKEQFHKFKYLAATGNDVKEKDDGTLYKKVYYKIKKGDNLGKIAKKHKTSVSELCVLNNLKPNSKLKVGRILIVDEIFIGNAEPEPENPIDTTSDLTIDTVDVANNSQVYVRANAANDNVIIQDVVKYYTIKKGDNISSIARKHRVSMNAIIKANNIKPKTILKVGRTIKIPVKQPVENKNITNSKNQNNKNNQANKSNSHIVKQGDTFYNIAKTYNVSVDDILKLNNLKETSILNIGQKIQLRDSSETTDITTNTDTIKEPVKDDNANNINDKKQKEYTEYKVRKGDTFYSIANKNNDVLKQILEINGFGKKTIIHSGQIIKIPKTLKKPITQENFTTQEKPNSHIVQQGDNLWNISKKHNVSIDKICELNKITRKSKLSIGMKLRIN